MTKTLLIIDDKKQLCETLGQAFEQLGYHAFSATNGREALRLLSQHTIHVVLLDIMLGEENGIEVLKQLRAQWEHIPVIMITGYASVETAVQSLKLGAFDYVKKPLEFDQLLQVVENAVQRTWFPSIHPAPDESSPHLITQHPRLLEIYEKAKKFAATDLPVLLIGENGTGKEILADFLHIYSPRKAHEMLKINCASFPETLLDNELFGHEKGAYTGATSSFKGVFERADHSSLFLDEIGDMPLTIQAKILRTLQNHEFHRLGGNKTITVDVRFIAATNKDLKDLIQQGRFREDLYYRLKAAVIYLPPLRERPEDIPLLADYFLSEYAYRHATQAKTISKTVQDRLGQYHWPGNVRELKNIISYAAAIASTNIIELNDLPPDFVVQEPPPMTTNIREDVEKQLILQMLQQTEYNKKKTAEILNMSRRTLYRKLDKYGIATPQ